MLATLSFFAGIAIMAVVDRIVHIIFHAVNSRSAPLTEGRTSDAPPQVK